VCCPTDFRIGLYKPSLLNQLSVTINNGVPVKAAEISGSMIKERCVTENLFTGLGIDKIIQSQQ
jgi:hypothetical protein